MNASWYDVLDVEPTASAEEIRGAWRRAVADLDPTDRRFRVFNQAAEVLLDPARRTAYDAQLAAEAEQSESEQPEAEQPEAEQPESGTEATSAGAPGRPLAVVPLPVGRAGDREGADAEPDRRRHVPVVPGWLLVTVAALLAVSLVGVGVLLSRPSDAAVENDTQAAQSAAERAIVPVLSYDAHHLAQSQAAAEPYLTAGEKQQYDKLFAVIRQNAPRTGTVVRARYLSSGIVRSGADQVDVLVFVDQVTRNKQHPKVPVVYKNQVTVTMAKVGGDWLVDNLTTTGT